MDEHEARGETERVYHEIRQTLRVTGINLNFRVWASFEHFFPAMWDAVQPNAQTRAFEDAADRIRAEAARSADALGRVHAVASALVGESPAYQVRAALDLYHYVNPKLLLLTSGVRLALEGERVGGSASGPAERIVRGAPPRMYPMEMVSEEPDDERTREIFADIQESLGISRVNSDYRTLALWPAYLEVAWRGLKPIATSDPHRSAAEALRQLARTEARAFPYPLTLTSAQVEALGEDASAVLKTTAQFEDLLPGLILNVALLALEERDAGALARSPFPAATAGGAR
ncbi:MAG: halocarboxylic acid dehydrogenase DehI family protein [Gemmatimonadetes bacterium]|nr:halocarboxylic acid dehydrogenase DehI family protein [Gemmatimonadota bacterium]